MRRWASLLGAIALLGSACGPARPFVTVSLAGGASGGGVSVHLLALDWAGTPQPWRRPPPGSACVNYQVEAVSVDGQRHELRADQFEAAGASPGQAVGLCEALQIEPTWVGATPVVVPVTIVVPADIPLPDLRWHP